VPYLCGLDEAGRGPLAGPVCAAAVILPDGFPLHLLADSKQLSAAQRAAARVRIREGALAWGIGWAFPAEIDRVNILKASLLAMERAYAHLCARHSARGGEALPPHTAVADGLYAPALPIPCEPRVKADASVPAVMAASILAKTARDALLDLYEALYPGYGYARHKGYPTKAHREAIGRLGPSPIQRMTFRVRGG
jgi:ribonuclease HII